jgi:hypothetical protein
MMFKISWGGTSAKVADRVRFLNIRQPARASEDLLSQKLAYVSRVTIMVLVLASAGCRTAAVHIPPANLQQPGWTVHQGQAVWHIPQGKREIAGEVLVATGLEQRAFVQFSKSPFPLVIAQATGDSWEIEFPAQNKHYSGRGTPPKRIIWLYLPRVLSNHLLPKNWTWKQDSSGWRLENHSNGEVLEGYFDQ